MSVSAAERDRFQAVFFDHGKGYLTAIDDEGVTYRRHPGGGQWEVAGKLKPEFTVQYWIDRRESFGPMSTGATRFEREQKNARRVLPSQRQLDRWGFDSVVEATDGCDVEPDGWCEHGYKSWFIVMGVI